MLQGATHSRTILGVTTSPPRVVLWFDETGLLRCVVPADLDGQQYQLVIVRPDRLSEKQALARRGAMMQGWRSGGRAGNTTTFLLRFDDAPPSAPPFAAAVDDGARAAQALAGGSAAATRAARS